MSLIEQFIDQYRREYDYYDTSSRIVAQQIESKLEASGIRAIVTWRAKNLLRLKTKVENRNASREIKYATVEEIFDDIVDLAGVRVALYFPADRENVDAIIRDQFVLDESKSFPQEKIYPSYTKRFSGYWATHYRIHMREDRLSENQRRYSKARVEIQVASVLMHAWSEVEHDLVYKPLSGALSEDEKAILDELNGLVLSGEIALERLQRAGLNRINTEKKEFSSQYELASYLYNAQNKRSKSVVDSIQLGNIELLFKLASYYDLANPTKISEYLKKVQTNQEKITISELIIDQIITGNQERYNIYIELSEQEKMTDSKQQNALGLFVSQWISIENSLNHLTRSNNSRARSVFNYDNLKKLQVFTDEMIHEVIQLRRVRNYIIHGIEIPDTEEIVRSCKSLVILNNILNEYIKNKGNNEKV